MALNRDEIFAAIARRSKDVVPIDVPEWGGSIFIRRLSAVDAETTGLTTDASGPEMVATVMAASITDADGAPLFSKEDIEVLAGTDMATAARVFAECVRVNGLMSEDLDEAVRSFTNAQSEPSSSS